jgi:hypothetical protein
MNEAEETVAMGTVLAWLSLVGPQAGRRLPDGCALGDGDSEDALPIAGLGWGAGCGAAEAVAGSMPRCRWRQQPASLAGVSLRVV